MYKITETYEDYDGVERKEDFYFNFTEAELTKMQYSTAGGLATRIQKIIDTHDTPRLIEIFEDLISRAYGQKSEDGRRFIKSDELTEEFKQTEAYSQIYMRLATDEKAASDFINHVVPKKLEEAVRAQQNTDKIATLPNKSDTN